MKKLLFSAVLLALVAGCAITDYPVITDARGSYDGVIRTGHKAYIIPSGQVATLWPEGSEELFSMVYQSQFGDQTIQTHANIDPTSAFIFLGQTYCDWRFTGCELARAWNPVNGYIDNPFDYESFPACPGFRSLSVLVSYTSRYSGECGDGIFGKDKQALYGEFANLATTTWRGGNAYILPLDSSNTTVTLSTAAGVTENLPIYGSFNNLLTDRFQLVVPMTPNARHELRWLSQFVAQNGNRAALNLTYNSLNASVNVGFAADGINYNLNRF